MKNIKYDLSGLDLKYTSSNESEVITVAGHGSLTSMKAEAIPQEA